MVHILNCLICGKEFKTQHSTQVFCSKECSKDYSKKYQKEYYQDTKEKRKEHSKKYQKEYYQDTKEKRKEYYQENKEEIKESSKKYRENHKEEIKEYYQDNKEELKGCNKEYQKTPKGKEGNKRYTNKRNRNLGFNPLNMWFENSNAHHINKEDVIYIPKSCHFYGGHSVLRNRNMEPINTVAFFFLLMQNIVEFRSF